MNRIVKSIISIVIIIVMGILMFLTMQHIKNQTNCTLNNDPSASTEVKNQPSPSQTVDPDSNNQNSPNTTDDKATNNNISNPSPTSSVAQSINEGAQYGESINSPKDAFTLAYYLIFAVEGLILSITLVYLLMSKFYAKTFMELFSNSSSIIIYLSTVIILTSLIVVSDKIITQKYFLSASTNIEISVPYKADSSADKNDIKAAKDTEVSNEKKFKQKDQKNNYEQSQKKEKENSIKVEKKPIENHRAKSDESIEHKEEAKVENDHKDLQQKDSKSAEEHNTKDEKSVDDKSQQQVKDSVIDKYADSQQGRFIYYYA